MAEVTLFVGGKVHRGWKNVQVHRAIDQLSGTFTVGMTERLTAQSAPLQIKSGQAVVVKLDGETVMTGYIDSVQVDYDSRQHSIVVSGRDKTADCVDCSAASVHLVDQSLLQIAELLCKPLGIAVISEVDTLIIKDVKTEEGESVFDLLEKLARANAVLLTSNAEGNLVITRGSTDNFAGVLELGKNIKAGSGGSDFTDRYSLYSGKGSLPGTDQSFAESASQISAKSTDSAISRYRPLVILPEEALNAVQMAERLAWESNARAARSVQYAYEVAGWINDQGLLWQANTTVKVIDPFVGLDQSLLVADVTFFISDDGLTCRLGLVAIGAYTDLPVPETIVASKPKTNLLPDYFLS